MDTRAPSHPAQPPEFVLEVFASSPLVKDILKACLHTILFHRIFTPTVPLARDVLDTTYVCVSDPDLDTLVDQRAGALARALMDERGGVEGGRGYGGGRGPRGQIAVQFFEKRRRKAGGFLGFGAGKGEEEVCWERWILNVVCGVGRTESEARKVRTTMATGLSKTVAKISTLANEHKDHIPPITTTDANPFPYQILVNPKNEGWGQRMGIF